MFEILLKTGFPVCLFSLLMNWYSKLTVAVRWKGFLSFQFCVTSGVRQGGSSLYLHLFLMFFMKCLLLNYVS